MLGILEAARAGAFACGLLSLFSIGLWLRIATVVNLGLLALHPAWTMSPYAGDCGSVEITAVLSIAILSVATFAWDLMRR